jgi:hypothetical protein
MTTNHPRTTMFASTVCGLATALAVGAHAASGPGVENLQKGHSYALPAVTYCTSADAVTALVGMRQSGDLASLPAGCHDPRADQFAEQFKGFIPDYKVAGLTVQEQLAHSRRSCVDPRTGQPVACGLRVVKSGFIAGTFVQADASRLRAFIEVGYGIEVVDPRSGTLQFAPLSGQP